MSQDQVRCPSCRLVIRFRHGLPDEDWIECPRCGDDVDLDDVFEEPRPLRGGRTAFDDAFAERPRRRRAPQRRSRELDYEEDDYGDDFDEDYEEPRRSNRAPAYRGDDSSSTKWAVIAGGVLAVILIAGVATFFLVRKGDEAENIADNKNPAVPENPRPMQPVPRDNVNPVPNPIPQPKPAPRPNPLPGAEKPIPGPQAPVKPPVVAANGAKLRYNWQPGQQHTYQIDVSADLGNSTSEIKGQTTYTVTNDDPQRVLGLNGNQTQEGSGTGFVIHADGYLATCAHVVEDATEIKVILGGKTYEAVVVAVNEDKDLAIIRITAKGLPVVPLADSRKVQLAQAVRVVGFPLKDVLGTNVKVTQGSIAGMIDRKSGRIFQVDASINPGNSGGPVVNGRGEVIGIASAKLTGNVVDAVGFAVPTNELKELAAANKVDVTSPAAGGVDLAGPDLARKVTPAIALLEVTAGPGKGRKVVLKTTGSFTKSQRSKNVQGFVPPSIPETGSDRCELVVNDKGEILHSGKSTTIPYMLEQMAHVGIEPLASRGQANWHTERTIILTKRKQSNHPLGRFGPRFGPRLGPRFGPRGFGGPANPFGNRQEDPAEIHPANERQEYTLINTSDTHHTIKKTYELKAADGPGGKPFLHLAGQGEIRFDRKQGLVDRLNFKMRFTVNEDNRNETVPVSINVKLLSRDEVIAQKKDREQRMADARKRNEERKAKENSPETLNEHLATLEELAGGKEFSKRYIALNALQRMKPEDHQDKRQAVLDVVRPLLSSDNSSLKGTSQKTFAIWADKDELETLIELLKVRSSFTRGSVIEALGRIGGKEAAVAVAPRLAEGSDRRNATKALINIGNDAEDAVIELIDHKDLFTRKAVYEVLGEIGGEKSQALLKDRAVEDGNPSGRRWAQSAFQKLNKK